MDVLFMFRRVIRIDEDVVKVDSDVNIQQVTKNVVHKPLKRGRGVSKAKWHDEPFKRPVTSTERCLPFVAFRNMDEMIGMTKVDGRIDTCFTSSREKVRDKRKRVTILLCDFIQTSEVDAKS